MEFFPFSTKSHYPSWFPLLRRARRDPIAAAFVVLVESWRHAAKERVGRRKM